MSANPIHPVSPPAPAAPNPRKKLLLGVGGVVVVSAVLWALYEGLVAGQREVTDNAYVQGHVVQITPQVGGTVLAVHVEDTDTVRVGQTLVSLDPADAQVALDQAQAALAQAVRQTRTLYANNATLGAQIAARDAEVVKAQAEVSRAGDDLARRQALSGEGAVSGEEMAHAKAQLNAARSVLGATQAAAAAAREQLGSNQALTEGTSVQAHPAVLAAAAKVREAWLAVQRAGLDAPVAGQVARRTVQVGQRVAAGTPLMTLIPLHDVWVDANFKEVQLRSIRIGQPVRLTADLYGKKVAFDGKVAGLAAGTGAAFALLPAQNATGNWIKVVQRVPVRVTLDPEQVKAHPLRVGLSMEATVDVRDQSGKMLADAASTVVASAVPAVAAAVPTASGADALIQRIIAAHAGKAPATPR